MKFETKDLKEIKTIAENLLEKAEAEEDLTKRQEIFADLDETIAYYKATSRDLCYDNAEKSGDPMKYAVNEFFFPTIKLQEKKDKDTAEIVRSIIDTAAPIELGDMHKKLKGIGADHRWIYAAEKLNFYLTARAAQRMNVKVNTDAFIMDKIAHDIDMGKDPVSNTNLLKTLQGVVTMMIGEGYKATSHDVNYLVDVYSNDSKKSKTAITAANHRTLRTYLKKVCYRILNKNTGYEVEQREIKENA